MDTEKARDFLGKMAFFQVGALLSTFDYDYDSDNSTLGLADTGNSLQSLMAKFLSWKNKDMNKHPWDWIIHAIACFVPVVICSPVWAIAIIIFLSMGYLEIAQKSQVWYNDDTWKEYFWKHSFGDLIANSIGIGLAIIVRLSS